MSNEKKNPNSENTPPNTVGLWIAIGAGIGISLGIVYDNLPIGIALGAGIGVVIGAALVQKNH